MDARLRPFSQRNFQSNIASYVAGKTDFILDAPLPG
jgi:hypothetical protein